MAGIKIFIKIRDELNICNAETPNEVLRKNVEPRRGVVQV
jgi:hypothetical protein